MKKQILNLMRYSYQKNYSRIIEDQEMIMVVDKKNNEIGKNTLESIKFRLGSSMGSEVE